ncbi:MAG: transcriptional regulator [Pararhodobacter sp.]|nr:transcriptional regulator [Pararhodobacter sp.]
MTTPEQFRAARALIGISQADLAALVQLSTKTIKRAEGQGPVPASAEATAAIRAALEAAGVVFLPENGNGPGVALKRVEHRR